MRKMRVLCCLLGVGILMSMTGCNNGDKKNDDGVQDRGSQASLISSVAEVFPTPALEGTQPDVALGAVLCEDQKQLSAYFESEKTAFDLQQKNDKQTSLAEFCTAKELAFDKSVIVARIDKMPKQADRLSVKIVRKGENLEITMRIADGAAVVNEPAHVLIRVSREAVSGTKVQNCQLITKAAA